MPSHFSISSQDTLVDHGSLSLETPLADDDESEYTDAVERVEPEYPKKPIEHETLDLEVSPATAQDNGGSESTEVAKRDKADHHENPIDNGNLESETSSAKECSRSELTLLTGQDGPEYSKTPIDLGESDLEMAPDEGSTGPNSKDVVEWDGPGDPENPLNWPKRQRLGHVALVSIIVYLVNLSTTISAPGSGLLMQDLHQDNKIVASFTISIFLLGFALGPLIMAPLSELYGRLIVYHLSIAIFVAFQLGCGWSESIVCFLILRFIAGCAAASPSTIGGGTVADVIPVHERGVAMAITALGPILAPVTGPVAGGFVAQRLSWRWNFWIVGIAAGIWLFVAVICMRETYAPVLLERKAARLRKTTGDVGLRAKGRENFSRRTHLGRGLTRPLRLLVLSPVVLLLSVYGAFVFGLMFLCFSTFAEVFISQYHFSVGVSGLTYLGQGTGMISGLVLFGALSDRILKARAAKHKGEMTPEERLPLMVYFTPLLPIGLFWYGWTAEKKAQWMAPIVGTSFIGLGNLFVMLPTQIYLVDAFGPETAASALAANSVLRSLFSTFLPLAAPSIFARLGYGWGMSLFGFLALAFMPVPVLFYKYGAYLRKRFQVRL